MHTVRAARDRHWCVAYNEQKDFDRSEDRHEQSPKDAVRHAATRIQETVTAPGERQDQLYLLNIFGELAYPRLDVERIIGSDTMIRESKLGRKIRRQAQAETLQAALLKVVSKQFGQSTATELTAAVQAVEDPELLQRLFDQAVDGMSADDLRSALHASGA